MNGGFFVEFSSGKCIGFVGVSGAIFCLTFQRFWRVGEDDTPSKKNPIYRPITAELSLETIRNSKMIYVLPSQGFRFLLHHCGCVTVKLRGVEAVAPVHMDRKFEHYDPRDKTFQMVYSIETKHQLQKATNEMVNNVGAHRFG